MAAASIPMDSAGAAVGSVDSGSGSGSAMAAASIPMDTAGASVGSVDSGSGFGIYRRLHLPVDLGLDPVIKAKTQEMYKKWRAEAQADLPAVASLLPVGTRGIHPRWPHEHSPDR